MFRLLLLASLCWITVAGSTCPKGFKLFERNPTARNNHTKQWCLGVFEHSEDLGNRELARHLCISLGASLSLPENQKEVDFALQSFNKTEESGIAIDGEMSRKCQITYAKTKVHFTDTKGECDLDKRLFEFDDANSDFTFLQQHYNKYIPQGTYKGSTTKFPGEIGAITACQILTNNTLDGWLYYGSNLYCAGNKGYSSGQKVHKVVCGRHPI